MKMLNVIMRSGLVISFLLMASLSYAAPAAMSVTFSSLVSAPGMTSYCQAPPLKSAVSPNIMLVVDVSGSMNDQAYTDTYNSGKSYEGYFDPEKNYKPLYLYSDGTTTSFAYSAGSTTIYYAEYAATGVPCTKSTTCLTWGCSGSNTGGCDAKGTHSCGWNQYACCSSWQMVGDCNALTSGNLLNHDKMQKIDILRWAMTGGNPDGCDYSDGKTDGTYCNPKQYNSTTGSTRVGTTCNPTFGCVLNMGTGTTSTDKVLVPWDRVMSGLAFQLQTMPVVPRMGSMFFSGNGGTGQGINTAGKTYLGDFTDSDTKNVYTFDHLISAVNSIVPNNGTPTGPAMWDAFNYFAQKAPTHNGLSTATTATSTDSWRNPMWDCIDKTGSNCSFVPCADNFVILMSDGDWNEPDTTISSTLTTSGGTTYTTDPDPVTPAYLMHKGFANLKTSPSVSTSVQDVFTIALFQSGAATDYGVRAMKNVAMYGSFGYNATSTPFPVGTTGLPQQSCNSNTYQGSLCNLIPASSPNWDSNGNGVPDTYNSGDSADEVKDSIYAAILSILGRTTAGTAASVLASREGSGAALLQAVYYPQKTYDNGDVSWVGNMQALWYYIDPFFTNSTLREDNPHDFILNLQTGVTSNDYITQFYFDQNTQAAMASRWTDTNGDGSIAGETPLAAIKVDDVSSLWSAGSLLWSRDWKTRTVYAADVAGTSPTNNLIAFSCTAAGNCPSKTALQPYLNAASTDEASTIIEWTLGNDSPVSGAYTSSYRTRAASINGTTHIWKLSDIINATPKIATWQLLGDYQISYPTYETTYAPAGSTVYQSDPVNTAFFATGYQYKGRGMAYVGGNDGMLHAFRLGLLQSKWSGQGQYEKAKLTNKVCSVTTSILCASDSQCPPTETCSGTTTLGDEAWAFIPKNVLPYLKYLADPNYCHLFTVDLTPTVFDASIAKPAACAATNYYDCLKDVTSWRTILIGGMRLGGACRNTGATCTNCVKTPLNDPVKTQKGLGYSSYFALDVTDQNNPKLMWEYDGTVKDSSGNYNNKLGFSFSGPDVARISHVYASADVTQAAQNNGKWLVTFASGPTGSISSSYQFGGVSDQNLTLHTFDLATGPGTDNANVTLRDTGIANAFGGAITTTTFDITLDYSDDVLYIPYTSGTDGLSGGLLRLVTNGDIDPANWTLSHVIDSTGPITAAPNMLLDPRNNDIWLFFGTGRYFYDFATTVDDADPVKQRQIFGIKEQCLNPTKTGFQAPCPAAIDFSCATPSTVAYCGGLTNVDNISMAQGLESALASQTSGTYTGWYIDLDRSQPAGTPPVLGERMITNPSANTTGIVYFTTFKPQNSICYKYGQTNIWAVKFDTGGSATGLIQGTALIQLSTGSIEQINLSSAFTQRDNRRTAGLTGQPPTREGLTVMPGVAGMSKPLFMKER